MSTNTVSPANTYLDLPNLSVEKVSDKASSLYDMAFEAITHDSLWLPITVIICALAFGAFFRRVTSERLHEIIDKQNISYRANQILKNIAKLSFQTGSLVFVSLAQIIIVAAFPDIDTAALIAISKLLIAWIFIRILAQIIENSFVRKTVALFAWIIAALSILNVMEQTQIALDAIGMNFGDWRLSLLTIAKFTVAIFVLLTVTRLLVNTAERNLQRATDLSPSVRVLLIKIIKVVLVSLAVLIGITTAGIDLSALAIFGGQFLDGMIFQNLKA